MKRACIVLDCEACMHSAGVLDCEVCMHSAGL